MNSLQRSFFCSLIAIKYIELHTPVMGPVVLGVVEEGKQEEDKDDNRDR